MSQRKNDTKLFSKNINIAIKPNTPTQTVTYGQAVSQLRSVLHKADIHYVEFLATQIIQAMPKEVGPRLLLLEAFNDWGELKKGEALAEDILAKFPADALALEGCSPFYLTLGNAEKALALMERVVKIKPNRAFAHFRLGNTLSMMGEKERAVTALTTAIKLDPKNAAAHYARAFLLKDKTSDKYRDSLEKLIQSNSMDNENLISLHYAAALSYGSSRPAEYFEHLAIANRRHQQQYPWDAAQRAQALKDDREYLQSSFIESVRAQQADQKPSDFQPIFIASMPRSGSTLLEHILTAHSQLTSVGESGSLNYAMREIAMQNFTYANIAALGDSNALGEKLPKLASIFQAHPLIDRVPAQQRIVDKSMSNISDAGLISLIWPKAKIIYLRRDPLDTILSCYQTLFSAPSGQWSGLENLAHLYQMFEQQMAYWQALFPENIYTVHYEQLVIDNEINVRKLLDFCELPFEDACLTHHTTIGNAVLNASHMQVREPLYQNAVQRWKPHAQHLQVAIDILDIEADN